MQIYLDIQSHTYKSTIIIINITKHTYTQLVIGSNFDNSKETESWDLHNYTENITWKNE